MPPDTRDVLWNERCWVLRAVLDSWLTACLWRSTQTGIGIDCSWLVCLLSHRHPLQWGHICSLDTNKDVGQGRKISAWVLNFLPTYPAKSYIKTLRLKMRSLYMKAKWVHVKVGECWVRSIDWLLCCDNVSFVVLITNSGYRRCHHIGNRLKQRMKSLCSVFEPSKYTSVSCYTFPLKTDPLPPLTVIWVPQSTSPLS